MRKKTKTGDFSITVKILGKLYTSTGKTLDEALSKLDVGNAKGVSVWKVEHDKEIREKVVMPFITARLFNSYGLAHEVALKKFKMLFE